MASGDDVCWEEDELLMGEEDAGGVDGCIDGRLGVPTGDVDEWFGLLWFAEVRRRWTGREEWGSAGGGEEGDSVRRWSDNCVSYTEGVWEEDVGSG